MHSDGNTLKIVPKTVGTVLVDDLHRIWIVFKTFAHLFAIGSFNEAVDNQILEGWLVEQGR